jgi:hypothetical protein
MTLPVYQEKDQGFMPPPSPDPEGDLSLTIPACMGQLPAPIVNTFEDAVNKLQGGKDLVLMTDHIFREHGHSMPLVPGGRITTLKDALIYKGHGFDPDAAYFMIMTMLVSENWKGKNTPIDYPDQGFLGLGLSYSYLLESGIDKTLRTYLRQSFEAFCIAHHINPLRMEKTGYINLNQENFADPEPLQNAAYVLNTLRDPTFKYRKLGKISPEEMDLMKTEEMARRLGGAYDLFGRGYDKNSSFLWEEVRNISKKDGDRKLYFALLALAMARYIHEHPLAIKNLSNESPELLICTYLGKAITQLNLSKRCRSEFVWRVKTKGEKAEVPGSELWLRVNNGIYQLADTLGIPDVKQLEERHSDLPTFSPKKFYHGQKQNL